jgi:hypothetical protein
MRLVRHAIGFTLLLLSLQLAAGCGGSATSAPPAQVPRAAGRVASLGLFVMPPTNPVDGRLRTELIERLVARGYTVTEAPANADIVIGMNVTFAVQKNFLHFGNAAPSYVAHAVLTAQAKGVILATGSADFPAGDGASPEQVDLLCSAVTGPRVENYAAQKASSSDEKDSGGSAPESASGEALPSPTGLLECEGNQCDSGNSGAWIFHGNAGVGRWTAGQVADLTIERFDATKIVIRRVDRLSSPSPGFSAVYSGKLKNGRIDGIVDASWPGHFPNQNPPGTVKYLWFASIPSLTCDASAQLSSQDANEMGGRALRFQQLPAALQCFLVSARQGDAGAKALVGLMYRDGIGTTVNTPEALHWLQASAIQDDYNGQLALAQMYELGMGTPADAKQGQYWRDRAQRNPSFVQREKNEARADRQQAAAQQATQSMMFMGTAALLMAATSW